jgi:hypothetical protein
MPVAAKENDARRMQMRYGFNEVAGWWQMSMAEDSAKVRARLRLMDTQVVRIFAFDASTPDPAKDWRRFSAYIQSVLDIGAVPMITFAKFPAPYDDALNLRTFVTRCSEIVWGCLEQWGGAVVKTWYWGIWNEPNNEVIGGGLTFEQYRRIYVDVATDIAAQLKPHIGKDKPLIGGPAVDGTHSMFWMDWIARLIDEVDDRLLSFVTWHCYGDWRPGVPAASLGKEMWGLPDAPRGKTYEALLMAQTPSYEARARAVARLLQGRDIRNFCGELNTIAHQENNYTLGLNQNLFGAAFYASAFIHLIRGGAELEMRWTGAGPDDAYALMTSKGEPFPAGLAKQLFVQHVRFGDWVRFPASRPEALGIDAVVAWNEQGGRSAVFVNTTAKPVKLTVADWDDSLKSGDAVLKLDGSTGNRIARERFDGTVHLEGYGLAVVTNAADGTVLD